MYTLNVNFDLSYSGEAEWYRGFRMCYTDGGAVAAVVATAMVLRGIEEKAAGAARPTRHLQKMRLSV